MSINHHGMREIEWEVRLYNNQILPGRTAQLEFTYANKNRYHHRITRILIRPSWDIDHEYLIDVDIEVDPMSEINIPNINVEIPQGLGGTQSFYFGVEMFGHNRYNDNVTANDILWTEDPLVLNIKSRIYRAFVSRSNHPNDVEVSDTIQNKIRSWGFETDTLFTDVDDPVGEIVNDAKNADCLFGIAVPRYQTRGGESPQFHYLDSETGMALVRDIPVVIFEHEDVDLKGIPRECFRVRFNDPTSSEFNQAFNNTMLLIRRTIQKNNQKEFISKALKIGGAMGVGSLAALAFGAQPENIPDQNSKKEDKN